MFFFATGTRKCGKVHLTVSSLKDTYLEMNWISKCDKARDIKPDYIGLFDYNPRDRNVSFSKLRPRP